MINYSLQVTPNIRLRKYPLKLPQQPSLLISLIRALNSSLQPAKSQFIHALFGSKDLDGKEWKGKVKINFLIFGKRK